MEKNYIIHYDTEYYNDGSNLLFSIEFPNFKYENGNTLQTGWYNDNHEFGDDIESMDASIKLAEWYQEEPNRIKMIASGYHDKKYFIYLDELREFTKNLLKYE